jgi:formamidopyrimidine-DNA glycosylase
MPELPEVETVRRGLAPVLEGRRLVKVTARRPDLRKPLPVDLAQRLTGRTVVRIDRRAKYLLVRMDAPVVLLAHLGMSGRMLVFRPPLPPFDRHDHVIFDVEDGTQVRFRDPRRFGLMDLAEADAVDEHPFLASLGPEPLGEKFDGPALGRLLDGRNGPIKAALMDQKVVAGLGNIYVCEALFMAGLSPRRKASTVRGARADRLATAIHQVLEAAIAAGGSSLRDHRTPSGELGYFQHSFSVYGREGEPCPGCDCAAAVKRLVQSGRSTFYCSARQR